MPSSGDSGRQYKHRCTVCSVSFFSSQPPTSGTFVRDRCGGEVCLKAQAAKKPRYSDLAVEVVLFVTEACRSRRCGSGRPGKKLAE